jgi:hypothetical protein
LEIFSDFCVKFFGISGIFRKILRKKEQKFTEKRGAMNLNTGSRLLICSAIPATEKINSLKLNSQKK